MREILFRGKRIDNGEWVEGSLEITHIQPLRKKMYDLYEIRNITVENKHSTCMKGSCEEVDPSTVGQYTGLTDKNGKRIFEGDIVRTECDLWSGETKKEREEFVSVVRYDNKLCSFGLSGKYKHLPLKRFKGDYNEVIGNIHDNPELLEVSGDAQIFRPCI